MTAVEPPTAVGRWPEALARWVGPAVVVAGIVTVAVELPMPGVLLTTTALLALGLFVAPRWAMAVLAVFLVLQTPLVNIVGGREVPLGRALQRVDEAIAAAAAIRITVLFTWARVGRRLVPWTLYAGAFLSAGALSALVGGVPITTWMLGAFLALKFPLFLLLALSIDWTPDDARRIVRVALLAGPTLLGIAFLVWLMPGWVQAIFSDAVGSAGVYIRSGFRVLHAPFVHPGLFGWAMAVTGCYAAAALLVGRQTKLATVALLCSVVGVLGSLRRKPLIGLPVAVLTAVTRAGTAKRRWVVLSGLGLLALVTVVVARPQIEAVVSDTLQSYLDPYAPTTARVLLYATGWDLGLTHFPLGAGFGRFGGYVSELHYSPVYDEYGLSGIYGLSRAAPYYLQDTYWPHVLGEAGVLGLLVLAAFYLHLWLRVGRVGLRGGDASIRILAIGAAAALVEAGVESIAGPILEVSLPVYVVAVPLGIALGIAFSLESTSSSERDEAGTAPRPTAPTSGPALPPSPSR